MTRIRRAILLAFLSLERQIGRKEFTVTEVYEEARIIKGDTLNKHTVDKHMSSTMNAGKDHRYPGRLEIERVGDKKRNNVYRLTKLGRSVANGIPD